MNYLKRGRGMSSGADQLKEETKPLTPKREMRRKAWGSLLASVQTVPGLCSSRKCVRKDGHDGACWPT